MFALDKQDLLNKIISEVSNNEGCKLYDWEFVGVGNGRTLRVYIDKANNSVGIDDCVNVSRALNLKLDEDENLIPGGAYQLEVSSPGVDRVLKKDWHFSHAIGQKIYAQLTKTLGELGVEEKRWEKCKKTEMKILKVDEQSVFVELVGGSQVVIPFSVFEKARIVFEIEKGSKNK